MHGRKTYSPHFVHGSPNNFRRSILLDEINAEELDAEAIIDWLTEEKIHVSEISLLPYHDFGRDKYERLNRICTQNFKKPSDEKVAALQKVYQDAGYQATIDHCLDDCQFNEGESHFLRV